MASSVNSDNGVVSGTAGLKSSADSSGVLDLQTNGTTALSISASQVVTFANQPTYTGGTANGVLYLNGSKAVTSGSALVFDGTNLGVGTTNPAAYGKLAVNGSTNVLNGNFLYMYDSGNTNAPGMYAPGDAFAWKNSAGSTEWMRINSTGLGIGTSSPASKLTVASTGSSIELKQNATGSATYYVMDNTVETGGKRWRFGYTGAAAVSTFSLLNITDNVTSWIADSSGNLGLGVTPSAAFSSGKSLEIWYAGNAFWSNGANDVRMSANVKYNLYAANGAASTYVQSSGAHYWSIAGSGTAGNAITFTQAMTLDANSNLIVNDTSNQYSSKLYVNGAIASRNGGVDGTYADAFVAGYNGNYNEKNIIQTQVGGASGFRFKTSNGSGSASTTTTLDLTISQTIFYTGGTERARIDSSGRFVVGSTVGYGTVAITCNSGNVGTVTSAALWINVTSSSYKIAQFEVNGGGAVGSITTNGTITTYNTTSDHRLKNVTGNLTGYKERLMSLQPKQGTWKADGSEFRGFLAHEFAESYTASVTGKKDAVDKDGKPVMQAMQASSSEVMADLVALVQEQQAIIESLKARLDAANL